MSVLLVASAAVLGLTVGRVRSGPAVEEGSVPDVEGPCVRPDGRTTVSAYEWRPTAWRGERAARDLVRTARRLCLDRVYVDVTAAGADGPGAVDLARDVAVLERTAGAGGPEIGLVAGDPWWPTEEGRRDAERLLGFVDGLVEDGLAISALHLDVEPWGLEEWSTSKDELVEGYLRFVSWAERIRTEHARSVPVAYLVPYWFDGSNGEVTELVVDGRPGFPFDHLARSIGAGGALSVMAYRDRARGEGGIVDLVRREVAQPHVPVLVGVETTDIEPPTATFAAAPPGTLRAELAEVARATATEEIVINDVDGLRRLADRAP